MLYDHLGRLVEVKRLEEEYAMPSSVGVRNTWHSSVANQLTPERLGRVLTNANQNDNIELLTLCEEMEERDLHYLSVLSTRKLTVSGLNVMVESRSDEAKDLKITNAVRDLVQDSAFDDMLYPVLDALGKGYSVTEIMWRRSSGIWFPSEYKWRDPRHFQFDQETGTDIRMRDELNMVNGLPLEPFKFITHVPRIKMGLPMRGGLGRFASVMFMLKGYTVKDWWTFMELFGIPWRIGRYGPEATKAQKTALLTALQDMGSDAAAIIPESMLLEIKEASRSRGGESLFLASAEWVDKQVSKGVLGQTATTEGTPGKLGSDDVQAKVRKDIKISDAKQLMSTIHRDLIKPFVDLNFGALPANRYPIVYFVTAESEDIGWLQDKLPELIDRGLKLQMSAVRDKLGFEDPQDDSECLAPRVNALAPVSGGLAMAATAAGEDEIDHLVDQELDGWKRVMDPVLQPILKHAQSSKDYQSFLAGLKEVMAKQVDSSEFVRRLSIATFKARGLGDATDDV